VKCLEARPLAEDVSMVVCGVVVDLYSRLVNMFVGPRTTVERPHTFKTGKDGVSKVAETILQIF